MERHVTLVASLQVGSTRACPRPPRVCEPGQVGDTGQVTINFERDGPPLPVRPPNVCVSSRTRPCRRGHCRPLLHLLRVFRHGVGGLMA